MLEALSTITLTGAPVEILNEILLAGPLELICLCEQLYRSSRDYSQKLIALPYLVCFGAFSPRSEREHCLWAMEYLHRLGPRIETDELEQRVRELASYRG